MLAGGSRIYHHHHHHHHHHHQSLGLGFDFCTTRIVKLSSLIFRPSSFTLTDHTHSNSHRFQQRLVSFSSLRSKSPGDIPIVSDCFSQQEDDHDPPSDGLSAVAGGIVALGKFDALHIGHRELAIQASKVGTPFLLSFVGIAEVLGWEPRAPIVAKCDRSRVLASWAPYCGNVSPSEFHIEFSSVRHLNPMQFVEKLSKELKVSGVVAGENYRFGYKAAGDATDLVRLCEEFGIGSYIIDSVMDRSANPKNMDSIDLKDKGQVSSTRVRHALSIGDMKHVSELLGRRHRLVLMLKDQKRITRSKHKWRISAPKSCLLNLPPKNGFYENCYLILDEENPLRCNVLIDSNYIPLETDDVGLSSYTEDINILGVEFGY